MGERFVKLFSSILDSSVWSYDADTRIVWITLMAMSDLSGIVRAAIPGIAHRANVSIDATEKAMEVFQSPDKYSRSEAHEGRRIEKRGRDWKILNFEEHKKRQADENEKERKRTWWRENRGKNAETSEGLDETSETRHSQSQSQSQSQKESKSKSKSKIEEKTKAKKKSVYPEDFEAFYTLYPKKNAKGDAFKAWKEQRRNGNWPGDEAVMAAVIKLATSYDWTKDGGKWIPNAGKWLRGGGWDDEPTQQSLPAHRQQPKSQYEKNKAILEADDNDEDFTEDLFPLRVTGRAEFIDEN